VLNWSPHPLWRRVRAGGRSLLPSLLVALAFLSIAIPSASAADSKTLGREVVKLVSDRFYDPARAAAWAKAHADYADPFGVPGAFVAATNVALADLQTSHTRYYTADDVEYFGLLAIFAPSLGVNAPAYDGIGVDLAGGRFVRAVLAGGPAEAAGLHRGDEILAADSRPFSPIGSFRNGAGRVVVLAVRRRADAAPVEIRVSPRNLAPTKEWREDQEKGARLIPRGGRTIAYVRLFCAAGDPPKELLRDQLAGPLRNADALVLDFRGGWGGANPDFVDLFDAMSPVLTFTERDGTRRTFDPAWRKPVFVLIDRGTRSGKEVVAHAIKSHKLGTLVGERTAGAVVAGKPFLLSDRSLLLLAVADVLVDGHRLEGVGVPPDVEVPSGLPHADGSDPQLDAALDLASRAGGGK
jgi:carboxyl-terminal processing protease